MFLLTSNIVHAQIDIKGLEKQYNVKIDSVFLKATPYKQYEKEGVIYDEAKKIDWYNDIVIYEITQNLNETKSSMKTGASPAIFMLPGGGFFGISADDTTGMDIVGNLTLGGKLATNLMSKVYVIKYKTNPSNFIANVVFARDICDSTKNETGKALLIEASYKAFHDLRKILKVIFLDSASTKQIDPSNFFMIGSSAGAVLAINTLFLKNTEIPSVITYKNSCTDLDSTLSISIVDSIRNQYWPIPTMKGIVSMSGAWIYDNVSYLTDNTPASSLSTPLYLMHGTCDELINRKEGNIGFKLASSLFLNENTIANRFIKGKGSEYIFNAFKETHPKIIYGQVKYGSHGVFSTGANLVLSPPAWDVVFNYPNTKDPVTAEIQPFIQSLIIGTSNIMTYTKIPTIVPEKASIFCREFDKKNDTICFYYIPTPTINYNNNICHTTNYTATLSNLPPAPFTINWTASGGIKTIGATTGTSVQYSSVNASSVSGILKATITRGCSSKIFNYAIDVNKVKFPYIDMGSYCYSDVMGSIAREYPKGSQLLTFQSNYTNAQADGVTGYQWELLCGGTTYTTYTFNNIYSGNLSSGLILGPAPASCTQVRFRYTNPCGQLTQWFYGYLKDCPGWVPDYLVVYPNPTTGDFKIAFEKVKTLELNDELAGIVNELKITINEVTTIESDEGIEVSVIDVSGNLVHKTIIKSTDERIDISYLKPDLYKVVVLFKGQTYFSTIIKN